MSSDDARIAAARARVDDLRRFLERQVGQPVRLVETHVSWVLLTDRLAYKLKKPVRLPFLDFTTLAARRRSCEEELRLNRRLAPGLYRGLVDVVEEGGATRFGSTGHVVDVAVRMQRFPDGALWSEKVAQGTLGPADVEVLAERLARFHGEARVAPPSSGFGRAEVQEKITRRVVDAIAAAEASRSASAGARGGTAIAQVCHWLLEQVKVLAPHWEARSTAGRIRECHGDLHLGNVVQLENGPTAFDALEFDDALRWIDVLDDIAFLVMDLLAHERPALAWRVLDTWLAASGDHDGVPALRFYLVRRALVRAQVAALGGPVREDGTMACGAASYRAAAVRLATPDARLAITHGLPGSGKSHLARALLEAAGAIRLRSDVERKRLFGLPALAASHGAAAHGIYDAATTARTYARLHAAAALALRSGWPVIVDAAFLLRRERDHFAALAASLQVPFTILDCHAPAAVLRERLRRRRAAGNDPSEADEAVLERLQQAAEPLDPAEAQAAIEIDTTLPEAASRAAERWRATPVSP
jgi:aminoglycoside phosphotransferase family enzyme/predicted kinase